MSIASDLYNARLDERKASSARVAAAFAATREQGQARATLRAKQGR